jgi:hypothetical protein
MVRAHLTRLWLVLALGSWSSACTHQAAVPPESTVAQGQDDGLEQRADDIMAMARDLEAPTTALLVELAESVGGEMIKLEYRLKKRPSLIRKLEKIARRSPDSDPEEIDIHDALRYTMRVEDTPAGHHLKTIRDALARLEAGGHQVVKIKNYWPRGDNYSGVNTVLLHEAGLNWELQFHTSDSLKVADETHGLYEQLRLDTTPIERRRQIFSEMAAAWESVPIPADILVPASIHPSEEIVRLPQP